MLNFKHPFLYHNLLIQKAFSMSCTSAVHLSQDLMLQKFKLMSQTMTKPGAMGLELLNLKLEFVTIP